MMNISRVAWPPSNEKLISVIKYQQVKRERERERESFIIKEEAWREHKIAGIRENTNREDNNH
jgi:hypothetical protein